MMEISESYRIRRAKSEDMNEVYMMGFDAITRTRVFYGITMVIFVLIATLLFFGLKNRGPAEFLNIPPLTEQQHQIATHLKLSVRKLSHEIGKRNVLSPGSLSQAALWLADSMKLAGLQTSEFEIEKEPERIVNIIGQLQGLKHPDQEIILGAHYDTYGNSPGGNDNASGVATLLEIVRLLGRNRFDRTLKVIAFANEEPPFFKTEKMGSRILAKEYRKENRNIVLMLNFDMMGWYNNKKHSALSRIFLGDHQDFLAVIGNYSSSNALDETMVFWRTMNRMPLRGYILPAWAPYISDSDHFSFWQEGFPSLFFTDMAPFRGEGIHSNQDTMDRLDFDKMALAVENLVNLAQHFLNK